MAYFGHKQRDLNEEIQDLQEDVMYVRELPTHAGNVLVEHYEHVHEKLDERLRCLDLVYARNKEVMQEMDRSFAEHGRSAGFRAAEAQLKKDLDERDERNRAARRIRYNCRQRLLHHVYTDEEDGSWLAAFAAGEDEHALDINEKDASFLFMLECLKDGNAKEALNWLVRFRECRREKNTLVHDLDLMKILFGIDDPMLNEEIEEELKTMIVMDARSSAEDTALIFDHALRAFIAEHSSRPDTLLAACMEDPPQGDAAGWQALAAFCNRLGEPEPVSPLEAAMEVVGLQSDEEREMAERIAKNQLILDCHGDSEAALARYNEALAERMKQMRICICIARWLFDESIPADARRRMFRLCGKYLLAAVRAAAKTADSMNAIVELDGETYDLHQDLDAQLDEAYAGQEAKMEWAGILLALALMFFSLAILFAFTSRSIWMALLFGVGAILLYIRERLRVWAADQKTGQQRQAKKLQLEEMRQHLDGFETRQKSRQVWIQDVQKKFDALTKKENG